MLNSPEIGKIIYSRESWPPDYKRIYNEPKLIYIKVGKGKRNYTDVIKWRDRLLLLGIKQKHKCPYCNNIVSIENEVAFSFKDQWAMWENVFNIKVLVKEKERQIEKLYKLLEGTLSQLHLGDAERKESYAPHPHS